MSHMPLPTASPAILTRRQWLGCASAAAAILAGPSHRSAQAQDLVTLPDGKLLIVRTPKPLNAEPALHRLPEQWITPLETFFIRSHGNVPQLDAAAYRLSIEGLVERPQTLSLDELVGRFPQVDQTATLTCAGNRRDEFAPPKISGVPWNAGAIGNARWTGIPLRSLLEGCGLKPEARHVWFEGADEITDHGTTFPFGGSIPIERALAGNDLMGLPLLATHMNDLPLTPSHGAPLRMVVPGFIGARSVKWLTRLAVSDRPSPNHYQADAYKLLTADTPDALTAAHPIHEYVLNSVIAPPEGGLRPQDGYVTLRGFALAGGTAGTSLRRVEVSADDGQTWTAARVVSPTREYCWVLWQATLPVTPQTRSVCVRAADSTGQIQPREMVRNLKGYQYNAWHRVALTNS
ncbi:MAG: sulfite oxidase [Planctomycetaceae bacterium]